MADEQQTGGAEAEGASSPIVVGVSAVTGSRAALQWAVHEARLRRGRVRVKAVMAWRGSGLPGGAPGRLPGLSVVEGAPTAASTERLLGEFVTEALGADHGVELDAVEGAALDVLLEQSRGAALLVLDSPAVAKLYDRGARKLAPEIIYRADCPVVVMPAAEPGTDADLDHDLVESAPARPAAPAQPTQPAAAT